MALSGRARCKPAEQPSFGGAGHDATRGLLRLRRARHPNRADPVPRFVAERQWARWQHSNRQRRCDRWTAAQAAPLRRAPRGDRVSLSLEHRRQALFVLAHAKSSARESTQAFTYTDNANANGSVTDRVTGLAWQKVGSVTIRSGSGALLVERCEGFVNATFEREGTACRSRSFTWAARSEGGAASSRPSRTRRGRRREIRGPSPGRRGRSVCRPQVRCRVALRRRADP